MKKGSRKNMKRLQLAVRDVFILDKATYLFEINPGHSLARLFTYNAFVRVNNGREERRYKEATMHCSDNS